MVSTHRNCFPAIRRIIHWIIPNIFICVLGCVSVQAGSQPHFSPKADLPDAPLPIGSALRAPDSTPLMNFAPVSYASILGGEPPVEPGGEMFPAIAVSGVKRSLPHIYVPLKDCPSDETRARECRMHWRQMILESQVCNAC